MPTPDRRIAMLIDGDNAQPSQMKAAIAATEKYGAVITRRVYANWTNSGKSQWKAAIHANGMLPVQQFAYVSGKNATDMALIIEAMDLLYSGTVDGFCIVSSDSDYTRLAIRIREAGMFMMGIGRSNTPESFMAACAIFVKTEGLAEAGKASTGNPLSSEATPQREAGRPATNSSAWVPTIEQAIARTKKDNEGWAHLSAVGLQIKQLSRAFKPQDHGHKQLGQLIKSRADLFETKGSQTSIYVRSKRG